MHLSISISTILPLTFALVAELTAELQPPACHTYLPRARRDRSIDTTTKLSKARAESNITDITATGQRYIPHSITSSHATTPHLPTLTATKLIMRAPQWPPYIPLMLPSARLIPTQSQSQTRPTDPMLTATCSVSCLVADPSSPFITYGPVH